MFNLLFSNHLGVQYFKQNVSDITKHVNNAEMANHLIQCKKIIIIFIMFASTLFHLINCTQIEICYSHISDMARA